MRRLALALALTLAGIVALVAQQLGPEPAMAQAAQALIASLDGPQLAKLRWPFDSDERFNWHFIPRERQGLPLKEMNDRQRAAAFALLRAGLSEKGFTKTETVRSLEDVLRAASGSAIRDRDLYFFTIFGDPASGTWAWRYEGHHLAQNWTIVKGRAVATTPAFFGANPAEVREGPMKGIRALAAESDLAWQLLASLTDAQRREAVIAETAPRDIITAAERRVAMLEHVGVAASTLSEEQRGVLISLIEEHASSQAPALATARIGRVRSSGPESVRFAWMGATTRGPGVGYYYRIQGPAFLIEYDNTQNNANHQHVVWRDFDGDFGADVLAGHYANDPHHAAARESR